MSHLRESGGIEQDSDVVLFIHRGDYYRRNDRSYKPNHTAEIIVAKQRNGPCGVVPLAFKDDIAAFINPSP